MSEINKEKSVQEQENTWVSLGKDLLSVVAVVIIFMVISKLAFGLWTPMVAVESGSMEPHMQIGDIIFIKSIDKTNITTNEEGKNTDYKSFENYGNVILYRPYGEEGATPIIHRAMYRVEAGEPMWKDGPPAPYSGYITKGDNVITNSHYDQEGQISYNMPVKDEWIIGTAQYRIPYLGYVRLLFS
ncbi:MULTISPECIES: signal peptidase I [Methanosarcina]|jgi:signal peptidase|uniref:S26 family signal peptidase n=1 Tax=Methanosarcina spelaei TaxID=1036679 RepID=A0A2A2HYQ0_9EURY|nr:MULTISPECIES: signal peptidase I [Methanosarcina]MDW5551437.1 signal peptidase I [Methanosarcina sp.]MDW5554472.1 signal peptidase I [Methanosarcina sp.]MDW5559085.1 signal peptidase I [Methanosarcina sp.]PAV14488.1 S26 family signal peptidase [Methanosarcina spelaei]